MRNVTKKLNEDRVDAHSRMSFNTIANWWLRGFQSVHQRFSFIRWAELAVAIGLGLILIVTLGWTGVGPGQVTSIYQQASVALAHGTSPYHCATTYVDSHVATDWHSVWMNCYVYPPFLGFVFVPIAFLPFPVFAVLWELILIACAVYVTGAVVDLVLPAFQTRSPFERAMIWLVIFDLLLIFGPVRRSLRNAEVDVVITACIIAAWHALLRHQRVKSGILMGLAFAIKPTVVLMLGYYLWRREWKSAAVAAITGVFAILVPFALMPHQVLNEYMRVSTYWTTAGFLLAPKSISVFGVFNRALYLAPNLWRHLSSPFIAKVFEMGIGLAVYIAATWLLSRRQHRQGEPFAFGLMVLVVLLGSPLTEDIHMAIAVIPIAVTARVAVQQLRVGDRRSWITCAGLCITYGLFMMPGGVLDHLLNAEQNNYVGISGALVASYWFYPLIFLVLLYTFAIGSFQRVDRNDVQETAASLERGVTLQ